MMCYYLNVHFQGQRVKHNISTIYCAVCTTMDPWPPVTPYVCVPWIPVWRQVKKVKCTLVQALRLCTSRTSHRGSRGIALPFHDHGTRRWWGVSVTPRPLFTPGKYPVPIVQEDGWAPGTVLTGAENLAPNGSRSPDRLAHSQSLYRLRYPGVKAVKVVTLPRLADAMRALRWSLRLFAVNIGWSPICVYQRIHVLT